VSPLLKEQGISEHLRVFPMLKEQGISEHLRVFPTLKKSRLPDDPSFLKSFLKVSQVFFRSFYCRRATH